MREIKDLFLMAGNIRRFIILTILRCPFDALRTIIQASFLQLAFNKIGMNDQIGLYYACAMFGIGSLLLFLYNGTVWTLYAAYVTRWVSAIRKKLFFHIAGLSLREIEARTAGEWITRLNSDVQAAVALLDQPLHLPHAVVSFVNVCVTSVILTAVDPKLFGLIMLFAVPNLLISQLFAARSMTKLSAKVQEATANNSADMNALVICADTAMIYDAQGFLLRRFEESSLELKKTNMKIHHRRAIESVLQPLTGMGGFLVILLMGGSWVAAGIMDFGQLAAVFQYRAGLLLGSMMLANSLTNIRSALAGVKCVNDTLRIAKEEQVWKNH